MLEVYGPSLVEYAGSGILLYDQDNSAPITFRCVQLPNARIYVHFTAEIEGKEIYFKFLPALNSPQRIRGVQGILNDGRHFRTTGNLWPLKIQMTPGDDLILEGLLSISEVEISQVLSDVLGPPALLRFPITNLIFIGTQPYEPNPNRGFLILPLEIGGHKVEIFHADDIKDRESRMRAIKECTVTAHLDVPYNGSGLDDILDVVANLCALLSFAKGTEVIWPCYFELDARGNSIRSYHRQSITSDFGSIAVIDHRMPTDLKIYIENTYGKYIMLKSQYELPKVIHTIVQSKLDGRFAELRALNMVSTIDVLRGKWATLHDRTTIFAPETFKASLKQLKKIMTEPVKNLFAATDQQTKDVIAKLNELNRLSFRSVLTEMIADTRAGIAEDEIAAFVQSRNILVHEARFATEDAGTELMGVFHFADRLVLALLGYTGPYLDCRNWNRVAGSDPN